MTWFTAKEFMTRALEYHAALVDIESKHEIGSADYISAMQELDKEYGV